MKCVRLLLQHSALLVGAAWTGRKRALLWNRSVYLDVGEVVGAEKYGLGLLHKFEVAWNGHSRRQNYQLLRLLRCAVLCCVVMRCAAASHTPVLNCAVPCHTAMSFDVLSSTVLHCVMLCLCCDALCYPVLRCAVLYCAVLRCADLWYAALRGAELCCAELWCAALCCAVLCCAVLYCAVLRYAVLRCVVLCRIASCSAVLHPSPCAVRFYTAYCLYPHPRSPTPTWRSVECPTSDSPPARPALYRTDSRSRTLQRRWDPRSQSTATPANQPDNQQSITQ